MPILPEFNADAFVPGAPIDNPYFPLLAGQVRAYRAEAVDDESSEVEVATNDAFVTFETIDIQGVEATVVRDTAYLNGFLVEDTLDYYAQDQEGNVWYLGEDVINYRYDDDGAFIGTDDDGSFRAGVDGAQGGWKMQAARGFGAGYYQEFDPGNAVDEGIVVDVGQPIEIGLGTFEGAVKILDTTALGGLDDRVAGLDAGADDYLIKPFAFAELAARLRALARRQPMKETSATLAVADLTLDRLTRRVERGGLPIDLQPREHSLLEYLMQHAGVVVTRTMLLEHVWEFHFDPKTSVVETHMSRLRAKVDKPFATELIRTVRGAGYVLAEPR